VVSRRQTGAVYTVTTATEFRLRGLGPGVTNRKRKACFSAAKNDRLQTDVDNLFKKGRLWVGLRPGFAGRGIKVLQWPPRQRFWAASAGLSISALPKQRGISKNRVTKQRIAIQRRKERQCQVIQAVVWARPSVGCVAPPYRFLAVHGHEAKIHPS
jgi:hypothetical protein